MDDVIDILKLIYYFYQGSSKRNKEAEEIADIVEEEFLRPEQVNGTRWIDHKLGASSKLLGNWQVIVLHMQNYAEDVTNREGDRAKAKGILKKLLQYKLVWFLHFLKDLLNELATVSLTFQRENINVSSALTKLQASELGLKHIHDNQSQSLDEFHDNINHDGDSYMYKGHTLHNFIPDETLVRQKKQIVQGMLDCLHARFENLIENQNFLVCNAFDHKNWPNNDNSALLQYGTDEVKHVFNHFKPVLENAVI